MTFVRAAVLSLACVGMAAGSLAAYQPPAQEEFVPVDQLEAVEQIPAAPLVAAAYAVAWAAVLGYVWLLWRRLQRVERELVEVSRRLEPGTRR